MTSGFLADLAWDRLRSPSVGSGALGIPSMELPTTTSAGPVRLSVGPGGEARILLPILSGDPFPDIGEGPGLMVKDSLLQIHGRPVRFIDIMSCDRELDSVFQEVVAEILRRVSAGELPSSATESAVSDFRNLLRARRGALTTEKAIALLGEIMFLNLLLDESSEAWVAWNGPRGARHDFRARQNAVEVKTSLRSQQRIVEINAIDQLVAPDGGELHLACFCLEHDARGQLSVPEQADRALSRASNPATLRALFSAAGFEPEDIKPWANFRFSLLSFELYRVVEGFPRLIPSSFGLATVPAGVSHFRYRIDLSAASDFRLAPHATSVVLKGLTDGLSS